MSHSDTLEKSWQELSSPGFLVIITSFLPCREDLSVWHDVGAGIHYDTGTREQGWGSQDWGGEEWQTVHHITITRRCRRNNKHSVQITRKLIKPVLSQFKVYNCHSPTPPPTGTSSVLMSYSSGQSLYDLIFLLFLQKSNWGFTVRDIWPWINVFDQCKFPSPMSVCYNWWGGSLWCDVSPLITVKQK